MDPRLKTAVTAVAALALGGGGLALYTASRLDADPAAPVATAPATLAAPELVAVMVGGDATLDACARQMAVGADGAEVRAGPGAEHPVLAVLPAGRGVIVCNYADGWIGVVYPAAPDAPLDCGVATPLAALVPYDGPCHAGWIPDPSHRTSLAAGGSPPEQG